MGDLSFIDWNENTLDEIQAEQEKKRKQKHIDKRICICGHPVARHGEPILWKGRPRQRCQVGKHECGCDKPEPVLECQDPRCFTFKSFGSAKGHALMQGIAKAVQKEINWEWMFTDMVCSNCEQKTDLSPCFVKSPNRESILATVPKGVTVMLCKDCRISNEPVLLYEGFEGITES